ncbi:MAG: polyprenol monophosphomannose synthase [Patescibacteria group bacterium]
MSQKIVIILPTFNERENLPGIVHEIFALAVDDLQVLVVDDNSPDGTGWLADELARKDGRVKVLHRQQKEGLGRAYVQGFHHALDILGADLVFCMDADFSHDPKLIPQFIQKAQSADVVIGSRYVPGGKIVNWNWSRRFISALGNWYVRTVLGVPIRDLTTGYICFRKEVIGQIGLSQLAAIGYVILVELKYRSYRHKFRIVEIPITFMERRGGASKFSIRIMWESLWRVFKLRFK